MCHRSCSYSASAGALQAQEAHDSMMAWRAAEALRDLDGVAASIAAGQAEVGLRAALNDHRPAQAWCARDSKARKPVSWQADVFHAVASFSSFLF